MRLDYEQRIEGCFLFPTLGVGMEQALVLDPEAALGEVEWAIGNGARVVVMRAGPVQAPGGFRSPGDPVYDPFWARLAEARVSVAYHEIRLVTRENALALSKP